MESAGVLKRWLDELIEDARAGRIVATSAGAGPGRDYAYLHYRTGDDHHSLVVVRRGDEGEMAMRVEAPEEDVAELVDRATHGAAPATSR